MNEINWSKTLDSLLRTGRNPKAVERIIRSLPAGSVAWHPYGNDAMNDGTVRAARNAVCALAERVTNGIDALIAQRVSEARVDIEDIVKRGRKALEAHHLDNPREAARHYLAASKAAALTNRGGEDMPLICELDPSSPEKGKSRDWERALFDVFDTGTGVPHDKFQTTILSIHQTGNKDNKPWQAGNFCQGGSQSLGFTQFTAIVSRYADSPNVAFTIVRLQEATDTTSAMYVYLTNADGTVPFVDTPYDGSYRSSAIGSSIPCSAISFPRGTLVRHVGYDLTGYVDWAKNTKSVFRALTRIFFNPLFPFKLAEKDLATEKDDDGKQIKNWSWKKHCRNVVGSLALLSEGGEVGDMVDWRSPVEVVPLDDEIGSLGSIYYQVFLMQTPKPSDEKPVGKVVDPKKQVVVEYNGQVQGELALSDLSPSLCERRGEQPPTFNCIHKDLVIYVNVDGLTPRGIRTLSSTREGQLRETAVLALIREKIAEDLENNDDLREFEAKRRKELTSEETNVVEEHLTERLKSIVDKLLGSLLAVKNLIAIGPPVLGQGGDGP